MTGYKKRGGPKGHHKFRGPAKDRKREVVPVSISKNTMQPKIQNSADRALGEMRGNP